MNLKNSLYNISYGIVRAFIKIIYGKDEMLASSIPPLFAYLWSQYKLLFSHHDEDYQDLYGFVDYKDKVVLDIGADYGSTASFFFERGAKTVYGVERNKWMVKKMRKNAEKMGNLIPILLDVSCSNQFDKLLLLTPDIVKVDCEGCEEYLLEVGDSLLSTVNEYIIETHTRELLDAFVNKFEHAGYEISNIRNMNESKTGHEINLFYAKKKGGV